MKAIELYNLGYTDLVSVTPINAPLSPNSSIKPEMRGKAPGVLYNSGWGGYAWRQTASPTLDFVKRMDADGANIGLAAAGFPALDVDVKNSKLAQFVNDLLEEVLPPTLIRIGLPPKRLYIFRLDPNEEPFSKQQLIIPNFEGERHLIEVLGAGQQYLVAGMHPSTKQPYSYLSPIVPAAQLPVFNKDLAGKVLDYLERELKDFGISTTRYSSSLHDRELVNQDHLKAKDLKAFAAAVRLIRDTEEHFPTRQYYLRMGYGLKGATQDDPSLGLHLFQQWAATKDWGAENDPQQVEKDWNSFQPPYELGAEYVLSMARHFGYREAGEEFELEEPPFVDTTRKAETPHSDMWLADRLIAKNVDNILWHPQMEKWLVYGNGIWREDVLSTAAGLARDVCVEEANRLLLCQGASASEQKEMLRTARSLSSSRQLSAVLNLAKQDSRIIVPQDRFDRDADLLGTPDGVIDLESGERIPPSPKLYISKSTSVVPTGVSPLWRQFLDDATDGDLELELYLQRMAGYCLTAHTHENVLFFLWGEGKRGKSTFVDTLSAVLGSYARVSPMSTFISKKNEKHTTELAFLAGSRLVTAQETQEGEYWDEARIKSLTGGDSVTARFLFKDDFTFTPGFKLLFSGNSRPRIQNADAAMRRRIHLIPFTHLPKNIDLRFKEKLRNELGGVFQWMIDGVKLWRERGLDPPMLITQTTDEYFATQDPFGRWMKDCCELMGEETASALYQSWVDWCDKHGESAMTQKRFLMLAGNRGFKRVADRADGQMVLGEVSLKQSTVVVKGSEFQAEVVQ